MKQAKSLIFTNNFVKTYRFYSSNVKTKLKDHPYNNIHPWKSQNDFSKFLYNNVVYDYDGLVVINKPYGISIYPPDENYKFNMTNTKNKIVNAVSYNISESLSYLAEKLNYQSLKVIKSPEKYMSGLTLLAANEKIEKQAIKCIRREYHNNTLPVTYWIVTTKLPKETSGRKYLALGIKKHDFDKKLTSPTILTEWSKNAVKKNEVMPFYVDFKLLSNSAYNLASLIELSIKKRKWNAIRLFAAQILHSPILGDNIYGYLIQKVMDSYVNVGPFSNLREKLPVLNEDLLVALNLRKIDQEIIPVHIHLKRICLCSYSDGKDLILEAPLMSEFQWTCDKLKFKNFMSNENDTNIDNEELLHKYGDEIAYKI